MTPRQASVALLNIATKIDNSREPSKKLVLAELKSVLAALEGKQHRADWESINKIWPDVAKKFVKLQYMINKKDDNAANMAGAVSGLLQDIENAVE